MARAALLYAVPAALVAPSWLALVHPAAGGWRALALAGLALLPALARPRWLRAVAVLVTAAAAAWIALGVSVVDALRGRNDFFGPVGSRFGHGFMEFYDIALPFDPHAHPRMQHALLAGVFLFCLALALAVAARRPLAAGFVLVVGAGWPATLLPGGAALVRGALVLGGVLFLLAGLRETPGRRLPAAVLVGSLVVACALAASTSPAVAKGEFLHWQSWDLRGSSDRAVGVQYVWNSSYSGLNWPKKPTTVLQIKTGPAQRYWRATTLDAFRDGHWLEDLAPVYPVTSTNPGRDTLSTAGLPARARDPRTWVRQVVTVENLRDSHLVGASAPVAYDHSAFSAVAYARGGVATVSPDLARGDQYSVWSYAQRPTPAELARSKPVYPRAIEGYGGYLGIGRGAWTPPSGTLDRTQVVEGMIGDPRVPSAYGQLFRIARTVVGRSKSPYAAVVALESWFRDGAGFAYDNHPRAVPGVPPLVAFVVDTRRGYCQHFAGAMALMLRYLGIPARVAVGFASGSYNSKKRTWTVTDRDAHAWVEVWFRGYGWLPFDPTPGRGGLGTPYSSSSTSFDASGAAAVLGGASKGVRSALENRARAEEQARKGIRFSGEAVTRGQGGGIAARATSRGPSLLKLLAAVVAAILAGILLVKFVRRKRRYLSRDPRRVAAACRRELVEILVDQRLELSRSSTLSELRRALQEEYGVGAEDFVSAVGRARFGPPGGASTSAERAREELGRLRWMLRRRLGARERLLGSISLRSLRSA